MEKQTDREFGWDDTIQHDGSGFEIIPDGQYQYTVIKLERARFAGSAKLPPCNQANVTLRLTTESGDRDIEEKLKLHSKMEWILCAFFRSLGLRQKDEPLQMKWNEVMGKGGWCEIGHNTFKGDKGEMTFNNVKNWIAPEDAPQPATATFTAGEF